MTDIHTKDVRSFNMSQIKGKNTKPELLVRRFLHSQGFRYRLHVRDLPGRPDVVLKKYNTVIFIHGCFWHGHTGCKYFIISKTRTDWWLAKINRNRKKDMKSERNLQQIGWKVLTVWECDLKPDKRDITLSWLIKQL